MGLWSQVTVFMESESEGKGAKRGVIKIPEF